MTQQRTAALVWTCDTLEEKEENGGEEGGGRRRKRGKIREKRGEGERGEE